MKIVFFEVQEWEKDLILHAFPEAFLTEGKLDETNVDKYSDAELLSTFIYSSCKKDVLDKLPALKLIATRSTGYDHIDLIAAAEKNITVVNVPEYGSNTVAEHTFALILTLTRKIYQSINQAKKYDFDHKNIQGVDLFDKTLGIIGLGKIGMNVLKIAKGFGMHVIVSNRTQDQNLANEMGFEYKTLDELLTLSDIITLHLPDCQETHHTINKSNIEKVKKGAYIVNTARGGLIDTEAMVLALENGTLAGVGLDVLEEENELCEEAEILTPTYREKVDMKTLILDHVLMNHPHVIITPHNAFNSKEALDRITHTTIENIQSFQAGTPKNTVAKRP